MKARLMSAATFCTAAAASAQLSNSGFDSGFVASGGQAEVPAPWSSTGPGNSFVSFDTWDHTGGNGLLPTFANVFTGVTAASGTRWTGGWNFENMHQLMGSTLVPGQQYTVSAHVHAANANVGFVSGGFEFGLGATATSSPIVIATFPTVIWANGWVFQSATFTAPSNASALPYFFSIAYSSNPAVDTYVGIDDITITLVPAPGSLALVSSGLLIACRRRC